MDDKKSGAEEDGSLLGRVSRRSFLSQLGAAGGVATAGPLAAAAQAQETAETVPGSPGPKVAGAIPVSLKVNGKQVSMQIDPRTTRLDCLRESLQLTGTKKGCDHGQCGACTVHVNGRRINSCLTLAALHQGPQITTVESLRQPGALHPMEAS